MTLSKHKGNKTTQQDVMQCLATVKSLHPNWKDDAPELTLKLWHHSLKDYPVLLVKKAVYEVSSKSKFVPKLAEVIDAIEIHSNELMITTSDPYMLLTNRLYKMNSEETDKFFGEVKEYLMDNKKSSDNDVILYSQLIIELARTLPTENKTLEQMIGGDFN